MAPDAWNLANRIPKAKLFLASLPENQLARVIWSRVRGYQDPGLPRIERFESGADIFVDVIKGSLQEDSSLASGLKKAVGEILSLHAQEQELRDLDSLAEIVFLAARVSAEESIGPIKQIAEHPSAESRLSNNERLRSRALRALLGLLLNFCSRATEEFQLMFERMLAHSDCVMTSVTALVVLYSQDPNILVQRVAATNLQIEERDLQTNLLIAKQSLACART